MKEYTLLIIDMQRSFVAANKAKTIRKVIENMKRAISHNSPILLTEFKGNGYSHPFMSKLIAYYRRGYIVIKNNSSGAQEIMKCCIKHKLPTNYKICGVNFSCCVSDTAVDLIRLSKIKSNKILVNVVYNACNDPHPKHTSHGYHLKYMQKEGIQLLESRRI